MSPNWETHGPQSGDARTPHEGRMDRNRDTSEEQTPNDAGAHA